ncbi:YncE family protein [Corynebacterium sp. CCM 9203]|uniref:YncE family protein n=1 Tax=Corynebacterium sp. CCM 9203 TaxID=3057615 RepID=UPI003525EB17
MGRPQLRVGRRALAGIVTVSLITGGIGVIGNATAMPAPAPESTSTAGTASIVVTDAFTWSSGGTVLRTKVTGFPAGAVLSAQVDGTAQKWDIGGGNLVDTVTAENGTFKGTVYTLSTSRLTAGQEHTLLISDGDNSVTTVYRSHPRITVHDPDSGSETAPRLGAAVAVEVFNLPEGAVIDHVGIEGHSANLLPTPVTVPENRRARTTAVSLPTDPAIIGKPITVGYTVDGGPPLRTNGPVVAPLNDTYGGEGFDVTIGELPRGLYQSVYSARQGALFVTRTHFDRETRSPSAIMKVDPATLEVLGEVEPAEPAEGDYKAYKAFGIGIDDSNDLLWVTNTMGGTVAVYDANNLSLIHQFPVVDGGHPRSVVVDSATHRVYVTSPYSRDDSWITVYDGSDPTAPTKIGTIPLPEGFTRPMDAAYDQSTHTLYTVSLDKPAALRINIEDPSDAEVYQLDPQVMRRGSGVALDIGRGNLAVANQDTGNVLIIDLESGDVLADIATGDKAVAAVYEPVTDLFYVSNRDGGTVTAIDADTLIPVANLDAGAKPNHISFDGDGTIYVTNKRSWGNGDGGTDQLHSYRANRLAQVRLAGLRQAFHDIRDDRDAARDALAETHRELATVREQLAAAENTAALEKTRAEAAEEALAEAAAEHAADTAELEQRLTVAREALAAAEEKVTSLTATLAAIESRLAAAEQAHAALEAALTTAERAHTEAEKTATDATVRAERAEAARIEAEAAAELAEQARIKAESARDAALADRDSARADGSSTGTFTGIMAVLAVLAALGGLLHQVFLGLFQIPGR